MGAQEGSTADEYASWARRSEPPDNEVPVVVPVTAVLGRGEGIAVVLAGVTAASTGFGLRLGVRLRQPSDEDGLYGQFSGSAAPEQQLLVGLEDAAGRRASTFDTGRWPPPDDDGALTMTGRGGGGGGRTYDQEYWVSPLPADGPLRVVVRWDARGVPETVTEVDGAAVAVAAAGRGAVELWPWEAAVEPDHEEDRVWRPTDGWFSQP